MLIDVVVDLYLILALSVDSKFSMKAFVKSFGQLLIFMCQTYKWCPSSKIFSTLSIPTFAVCFPVNYFGLPSSLTVFTSLWSCFFAQTTVHDFNWNCSCGILKFEKSDHAQLLSLYLCKFGNIYQSLLQTCSFIQFTLFDVSIFRIKFLIYLIKQAWKSFKIALISTNRELN